jgi:hypothetical protein
VHYFAKRSQNYGTAFIRKHSHSVDGFVNAIEAFSQERFDTLCKNVILGHYFVYQDTGMVGTDLVKRIPKELAGEFSKMCLHMDKMATLTERHMGAWLLNTNPGFIFQNSAPNKGYRKKT